MSFRGRAIVISAVVGLVVVASGWFYGLRAPAGALPAGAITLPSGQAVTLLDVITNVPGPEGLAARFRFLAPAVAKNGGTVDAETAAKDMDWLCQNFALSHISNIGPQPGQIIISLSDKDVPFGETHPEATQLFNAYSIADGTCVWDMF
jgi:hypothetical protein